MNIDSSILQGVLAFIIGIVGYFLRQKDAQQEKAIVSLTNKIDNQVALLWQKHDQDAADLSELRLHIASQHYVKTELDNRFDKMELAFKHGFHELGEKLDKLTDVIILQGKK